MKKQILLLLPVLIMTCATTAQTLQTVVNNGNTVTTPVRFNGRADFGESYDPSQYGSLQITRLASQGSKFHLSFIREGQMVYGMGFLNNLSVFGIQPGSDNSSSNGIFIAIDGKVGIGTPNPNSLLNLNGQTITNPLGSLILNVQAAHSAATTGSGGIIKFTNNVEVADVAAIKTFTEGPNNVSLRFQTGYGTGNLADRMIISNTGNIGIGTAVPTEKLSVKGKIRAQEVKVEMANWSDFVFAKDYPLPTLAEIEKHIKENGHLPEIPSAAEVVKNGIELGEMNKKLLQKIEELTLYLIEKDKKEKAQQQEIDIIKGQLNKILDKQK